ncbi:MAG: NAD(+)/NADH kinase, partial [Acidobacteriota bacterium]
MKIGIVAKPHQMQFEAPLTDLLAWLQDHDCQTILEEGIVQAFDLAQVEGIPLESISSQADIILVFGGDGTMLRVARSIEGRPAPILGVNLGSLGFLTEITLEDLYPALERVLEGKHVIDRRNMLKIVIHRASMPLVTHHALNDAVINSGALARLINMDAFVDEDYIASFPADGMIISTPTGSTAYSLSAGGPVLYPKLDSVVMTPICSHTLTSRPLVIPSASTIRVVVRSGEEVMLT